MNPNNTNTSLFPPVNRSITNLTTNDNWVHSCEALNSQVKTSLQITLIISLLLCVLGNGAMCVIVARHYMLQTVTNAHIVNMAIGHLLFALVCVPGYLSIAAKTQVPRWICLFHGFFFILFSAVSALALVLIAVERCHVLLSTSKMKLSAKVTTRMILATWFLCVSYAVAWILSDHTLQCTRIGSTALHHLHLCMPLLKPPESHFTRTINLVLVILCFFLPMTITLFLYFKMWGPLWRGYNVVRPLGAGNPRTIRFTAEIKTTRTMLVIFLLSLASWGLYWSLAFYNAYHWPTVNVKTENISLAAIYLAFVSVSLNPLIYALRNPRFSIILSRRKQRKKVKFSRQQELEHGAQSQRRTTKWARDRLATQASFDTSRSDECRATPPARTVSTRLSASTVSFSYVVTEEACVEIKTPP